MLAPDERRRDFLKAAVRWLALPATVAGLARMVARNGETCDADFVCSRCRASRDCKLPQAVSYRQESREVRDG